MSMAQMVYVAFIRGLFGVMFWAFFAKVFVGWIGG